MSHASLVRRTVAALRRDWSTLDDPWYMGVVAGILLVGIWLLLVEGGNRVVGAVLVPFALLAV